MSRVFAGNADNLKISSAVLTGPPLTFFCWFNVTDLSTFPGLLSLGVNASNNNQIRLNIGNSGNINMLSRTTTSATATTAATVSVDGLWHNACGVTASATSRAAYLDGASKATNTTSRVPTGLNETMMGNNHNGLNGMNGPLAHVAIWNTDLTDDEVAMLGISRISPLLVRPQNLVLYSPYLGRDASDIDIIGSRVWSSTNTSSSPDEPPVLWLPGRRRIFLPAGSVFNDAISEAATASDSISSGVVAAVALTETGNASDTVSTQLLAAAVLSESISGADIVSAIAARVDQITESGSASDLISGATGGTSYNVSIVESAAAVDAITAIISAAVAVGESGAAADAYTALRAAVGSISESGSVLDAPSATWTGLASLAEVALAIDQISFPAENLSGGTRIVIVRATLRAANYPAPRTVQLLQ